MSVDPRGYGERIKDCIVQAVVGEQLGSGCYRTVFALSDDRVLKVEAEGQSFSNQHEWSIWEEVRWGKWAEWFAPCLYIDAFGTALIQARTTPLTDAQWRRVKKVPSFMADVKQDNFGMLKGRVVCHDYGNHGFFRRGLIGAKLVERKE